MNKDELRSEMKRRRKNMTAIEREQRNAGICNNLALLGEFRDAVWYYPYVSYKTEADTIQLINQLFEIKKERDIHIAVPRVNGKEMDFYEINSFDDMKPGYDGILEPVGGNAIVMRDGIMIMPGLAFDLEHNRLGYGGGYYDRYLSKYDNDNLAKIAISYDCQIVKYGHIQTAPHDIKPDRIVTERAVY